MVEEGTINAAIRDPSSIWKNSRNGRRLAALTRWTILDMVVISNFATRTSTSSWNFGYDEPRKTSQSNRENPGSYGTKTINSDSSNIRRNNNIHQHLQGWCHEWNHRFDGSTILGLALKTHQVDFPSIDRQISQKISSTKSDQSISKSTLHFTLTFFHWIDFLL